MKRKRSSFSFEKHAPKSSWAQLKYCILHPHFFFLLLRQELSSFKILAQLTLGSSAYYQYEGFWYMSITVTRERRSPWGCGVHLLSHIYLPSRRWLIVFSSFYFRIRLLSYIGNCGKSIIFNGYWKLFSSRSNPSMKKALKPGNVQRN